VRDHVFRSIGRAAGADHADGLTRWAQVLADPIQLNSRLRHLHQFRQPADLAGLALPASMRPDGTPFGVTLLAPGGQDALLASLGRVFHANTNLPMGATGKNQPPLARLSAVPQAGEIAIAAVGAHLSGMPLNGELKSYGARFLEKAQTAPDYCLFALETKPLKPGLLRVAAGQGASIAVEIWALPAEGFGRFVAAIPARSRSAR